jgi:acetolactate synthase-1/2/3 large subunit
MTSGQPPVRDFVDVDTSAQEWGSDYIADLLKAYGFEYVSFNPGASFRGLEESIVNYNDNVPQVIETTHEGLSVSVAHGYAKATGEPALCILHNVVGTMHGAMSLYNAFIDRVPVVALSGTGPMRKSTRRPWIDWIHTALVQGNIVRDYVKWDDQPDHIDGAAESIARAHRIADTAPKGPTYVTLDHDLQEGALEEPMAIPDLEQLGPPSRMAPDPAAIGEAADLLAEAEMPVVLVDQVGDSRAAVAALVDLAETLGAAVVDPRKRRFNFPTTHPLNLSGTEVYREADVVLALDVWSLNYTLTDTDRTRHVNTEAIEEPYALIDVGTQELGASSLFPQYYARRETDVSILADTELAIPALERAVAERLDADEGQRQRADDRFESLAERHREQRATWQAEAEAAWDETPIATARTAAEIWRLIEDEPWALVNGTLRGWSHRLWEIDEFDQYIGGSSGGGGSDTVPAPPSAAPWPTPTQTGRRSTSSPTAISCSIQAPSGPSATTRSPCSPSCTTTSPSSTRPSTGCDSPSTAAGTRATSRRWSGRDYGTPSRSTRRWPSRWASRASARLRTRTSWRRPSRLRGRSSRVANRRSSTWSRRPGNPSRHRYVRSSGERKSQWPMAGEMSSAAARIASPQSAIISALSSSEVSATGGNASRCS